MRTLSKLCLALAMIVVGGGLSTAASACDITSPTDISCGPANVNPGNPLSSLNPASPFYPKPPVAATNAFNPYDVNNASNPYSPYFSQPVYAYGILGLLEGAHPTIIYPAGPPRTCRLGVDCPQSVDGSSATPAAYPTQEAPDADAPVVRHHRHRARPNR